MVEIKMPRKITKAELTAAGELPTPKRRPIKPRPWRDTKGLMSPERFSAILLLLGEEGEPVPMDDAAELFGKSPRQVRYYQRGHTDIPLLVAEKAVRMLQEAAAGRDWRRLAKRERRMVAEDR